MFLWSDLDVRKHCLEHRNRQQTCFCASSICRSLAQPQLAAECATLKFLVEKSTAHLRPGRDSFCAVRKCNCGLYGNTVCNTVLSTYYFIFARAPRSGRLYLAYRYSLLDCNTNWYFCSYGNTYIYFFNFHTVTSVWE